MIVSSVLARIGIVLAVVVIAFGTGWLRGHNKGWDSAQAHDAKVVAALMTVKATDEATIAELKRANQAYADAAAQQQARAKNAVKALQAQQAESARAAVEAGRKLDEAIHANQEASRWGGTRLPAGVADSLRR